MSKTFSPEQQRRVMEFIGRRAPLVIQLPAHALWNLIACTQLALRHPKIGRYAARNARDVLEQLIPLLADGDAEIEAVLRAGNDPEYDVVEDPGPSSN